MMKGGRTMKTDFLILQRVLGSPWENAPAKAFCSKGEIWYLVVPRTVTPRLPKPSPSLASEVLIAEIGEVRSTINASILDI